MKTISKKLIFVYSLFFITSLGFPEFTFARTKISLSSSQPHKAATVTEIDENSCSFTFSQAEYTVNENVGTAIITVVRDAGCTVPVEVTFSTSDATALSGSDYQTVSQLLQWDVSSPSEQTVSIPIIDDSIVETPIQENVVLTLSNPSLSTNTIANDPVIINPNPAQLVILDDDLEDTQNDQNVCGDGVLATDDTEECDDGNLENNDGCDSSCHSEAGNQDQGNNSSDTTYFLEGSGCSLSRASQPVTPFSFLPFLASTVFIFIRSSIRTKS